MAFRIADHTADLAIEADADSQGGVLEEAALAMTSVLTGRPRVHEGTRPEREASFQLDAPDEPSMVVAFLAELLWLHESEDLLWLGGAVAVSRLDDGTVRVSARGNVARHDATTHGLGVEVKAVTYHGLRCERGADGRWHLWVLLDI